MKRCLSFLSLFFGIALLLCPSMPLASYDNPQPNFVQAKENRIALVIGNNAYNQMPLKNPVNDASSMATTLRNQGFQVDLVINANLREMEKAVDNFVKRLTPGRVALFYYAGHGIQIQGENYLVPTDFVLKDEADAKYSCYSASRLLERLEFGNNGLNIIILDACRNPFLPARSSSRGLAIMRSDQGTFIAFATAPGKTADDNPSGNNGLFTSYLLQTMNEPGLTLDQLFGKVRAKVALASNKQQVPWVSTSVIGEFYFNPNGTPYETVSLLGSPPKPDTTEEGKHELTPGEWIDQARGYQEGPRLHRYALQMVDAENTWIKYYAGIISNTDNPTKRLNEIDKRMPSHIWDRWFYCKLSKDKKLLLVWKNIQKGTKNWILVGRSGLDWLFQVNGSMPKPLNSSRVETRQEGVKDFV